MRPLVTITVGFIFATLAGCSNNASSSNTASFKGAPTTDLEARRQRIQEQETKVSAEAQARRERSLAILKAEEVPVTEFLPLIQTEAESKRRTTEEVATRALALGVVALKGEGLEQELVDQMVDDYQLAAAFTPKEQKFIKNPNPSQHDQVQFTWRYECFWVMLWALGFIDRLDRPDTICNVRHAVALIREQGREGFLQKAKLRSQAEILDAADLIYRYHWAVVDARINNREAPAGLDGGVVLERHHALNWLMGYMDQEWDDVSTDT